jgi:hypothetical protein
MHLASSARARGSVVPCADHAGTKAFRLQPLSPEAKRQVLAGARWGSTACIKRQGLPKSLRARSPAGNGCIGGFCQEPSYPSASPGRLMRRTTRWAYSSRPMRSSNSRRRLDSIPITRPASPSHRKMAAVTVSRQMSKSASAGGALVSANRAFDISLTSPIRPAVPDRQTDDDLPPAEIARRMERGIRRFLNTPPQPHGKNPKTPPTPKAKERPPSKGRVHKGKTGR